MSLLEAWRDWSGARKLGLLVSVGLLVLALGVGAFWLLSSHYEPAVRSNSPDKIAAAVREMERAKVPYRVTDDGLAVEVPRADVGRVKVLLAHEAAGAGSVGFELFNNTDFSTTEFTQKINYQRALQGELGRTISAIEGVTSARVHIVLPESGFLRRKAVPPTAAVNVAMNPGAQLSAAQVYGIQKLVAASVPEIKLDDIAVIDQDGIALTRNKIEGEPGQRGQLDLKRDVDAYLEGKVRRMLNTLDPNGEFSVSVDTTLNLSDTKVTTEDVLPVETGNGKVAGVVVRERQSQRQDGVASADGGASAPALGSLQREVEYKTGHRVEQVATGPGAIEHVSVAVLARVASAQTDVPTLRSLIANAVGAKEDQGDLVTVVMLPASSGAREGDAGAWHGNPIDKPKASPVAPTAQGRIAKPVSSLSSYPAKDVLAAIAWLFGLGCLLAVAWLIARKMSAPARQPQADLSDAEVDLVVRRIQQWMVDGGAHASS